MRPVRYFILILLLFIVGACGRSTTLTEAQKKEITESIRQTLNDYYADIRTGGLMAELNYLDRSDDFFWTPPGYTTSLSYDSVVTILQQNAVLFESVSNSWDTLRIIPLSHELATYTGRLQSVVTDTSGTVSSFKLVETGLLIKRKDGWKLLSGQTSVIN